MIRLGTRGSVLARTQSGMVARSLTAALGVPCELVVIRTEGDDVTVPLDAPARPGAFVSALRDALVAGHVDLAVHSFKDLPSEPAPGLEVAAVPPRQDPRDALVSRGLPLAALPEGARVGTSSPRRRAALGRVRPDLDVVPLRGNVDTRIGLVDSGAVDAAVLAAAGLARLARTDRITETLDPTVFVPAPAQGALAVECRSDSRWLSGIRSLDDPVSRLTVTAERAVLRGVQAACTTAIAAHAGFAHGLLTLTADLSGHRGVAYARVSRSRRAGLAELTAAADLGAEVAGLLVESADD